MPRTNKAILTMFPLLASWLVGVAFARADGASNGSVPSSASPPGLVLINGGAAERQRAIVAQTIEAAVRDAGWVLPSKPLSKSQSDSMLTCLDSKKPPATCVAASMQSTRIFIVTVEDGQAPNGAPMVVLTGRAS